MLISEPNAEDIHITAHPEAKHYQYNENLWVTTLTPPIGLRLSTPKTASDLYVSAVAQYSSRRVSSPIAAGCPSLASDPSL